jgi:hypothetical protein
MNRILKEILGAVIEDAMPLIRAGKAARKGFRAWRNRRRAKKGLPPKEGNGMQGFKTYTGILVAAIGVVLGWLGLGDAESSELAARIVAAINELLTIGGLLFAAYGRKVAKPE